MELAADEIEHEFKQIANFVCGCWASKRGGKSFFIQFSDTVNTCGNWQVRPITIWTLFDGFDDTLGTFHEWMTMVNWHGLNNGIHLLGKWSSFFMWPMYAWNYLLIEYI